MVFRKVFRSADHHLVKIIKIENYLEMSYNLKR